MPQITDRDQQMLTFEAAHRRHAGNKEALIESQFGVGKVAYYQALNRLIDNPEAMKIEPALVKSLLRARARRTSARAARALG